LFEERKRGEEADKMFIYQEYKKKRRESGKGGGGGGGGGGTHPKFDHTRKRSKSETNLTVV